MTSEPRPRYRRALLVVVVVAGLAWATVDADGDPTTVNLPSVTLTATASAESAPGVACPRRRRHRVCRRHRLRPGRLRGPTAGPVPSRRRGAVPVAVRGP